ncbi:hypothetical protein Cylst_2585 [Cylindrospermum stagnale PCC 7417]|uniref:Uncharacterized protein n=1 Tax=Cylindrospermum stagnale PCC 7417 TaxID=56107 RepID=K9WYB2_9NOST|nr:hypothetical protein [Cylindrospermum stagnale]AFZ24791.1 hypothetical protein Cylst_2585 [Cylindrospermum stagnale PCC 7417]
MQSRKNNQKILVLGTLLACIQLPAVWADVITPGASPVDYCFKIANINQYPNYYLIAYIKSANPSIPTYNKIIKQDKCLELNGYREYSNVYAIKKTDVKFQDIITNQQGESLIKFDSKKSKLIPAKDEIYPLRTLPDKYGIEQVTDVLEIVAIKQKSLNLRYKEVIYTSQPGKSEIKAYQTQNNRPFPSGSNGLNLLNLIIPGLSLIGIMLVYRKSIFSKNHDLSS